MVLTLTKNIMTTLSVPLNADLTSFVDSVITDNKAETKAGVVRMALQWFQEHMIIQDVLQAEQDLKDGNVLKGDLSELADEI